ncbi:MAG TPA: TetR/AcrR family transcriptional regulator [Actinoallomurus sp.]|jgi:AcrR family transcriptional regulator
MNSRVAAAVGRALDERQREATEEVERILAAAVTVMERVAPATPRVSDIVAEAGTSNKAFYRYFTGKEDLILAVMERGVGLVASYLDHQMSKDDDPARRLARWITGVLTQISDPELAKASRAVTAQLAATAERRVADEQVTRPLHDRLLGPVTDLGSADPRRDTDVVFATVFGVLRRHLALGTRPEPGDVEHLIAFCLNAIGGERKKH